MKNLIATIMTTLALLVGASVAAGGISPVTDSQCLDDGSGCAGYGYPQGYYCATVGEIRYFPTAGGTFVCWSDNRWVFLY